MVTRTAGTEDRLHATTNDDQALVLFSGGQDSTTCLAWALDRYPHVETVGFAYGQRHAVELELSRADPRRGSPRIWPRPARPRPHA